MKNKLTPHGNFDYIVNRQTGIDAAINYLVKRGKLNAKEYYEERCAYEMMKSIELETKLHLMESNNDRS